VKGVLLGDGCSDVVLHARGVIDHAGVGPVPHRRWLNHPRRGVDYPDYSTGGATPEVHVAVIDALASRLAPETAAVAGLDIGGMPLAGAMGYRNRIGCIDVRKVDAMRSDVVRSIIHNYELGDGVAVSKGVAVTGRRVALVDDCLMTGSAAISAIRLLRRLGASCDQALFIFDLIGLEGRARLADEGVQAVALQSLPMRG
jgi:adenine phosphoribosyltransferase